MGEERVTWMTDGRRRDSKGLTRLAEEVPLVLGRVCEVCGWIEERHVAECFRCGHVESRADAAMPTETLEEHIANPALLSSTTSAPSTPLRELDGADEERALHCLPQMLVQPFDHQIRTAAIALGRLQGRALLCDEVGLGKTIEAGLCISELLLCGYARRVLVLAPAGLVPQWQEELRGKFNCAFEAVRKASDWSGERVIASHELFRRDAHLQAALQNPFDLVVVDEAHKLKNPRTHLHQAVRLLGSRYLLLLTATPIQNNLLELYHLVSLLRPGHLGELSFFRKEFMADDDPREAKNILALKTLMQEVMVRHHRDEVGVRFPSRRAGIYQVDLDGPERTLYEAVTAYIRDSLHDTEGRKQLLTLMLLQKELCSSAIATGRTLRVLYREGEDTKGARRIRELARFASEIGPGTKARLALKIIRDSGEKAIVFTDYRATMEEFALLCRREGIRAVAFHGGLDERAKERTVAQFRNDAQVFISTESGSEGRNLQFVHQIINLDLPWNPMRLEQRIGRVHRLGQTREVVVHNLVARGTIEEYIMDVLATKIRLFELVVGELDMILGGIDRKRGFEEMVASIWRTSQSHDDLRKAFADLGRRAEAAREAYERFRTREVWTGRL